jgi:hypothetical protein
VKRLKSTKEHIVLQLGLQEKLLLVQILDLYPRIPAAYQPLSKSAGLEPSNQRLLEEALAEQRVENKKSLTAILSDSKKFSANQSGWVLSLTAGEMEQLLKVLNDIRVGSWLSLGSPELSVLPLNKQTSPDFWAMEMAGLFQMSFLEAMHEGGRLGHE